MSKRDRRVTLALKWHYLDNLDVGEIQERFEETGHGSFARSTIRKYLNEDPAEEVLEQIERENANVRLQIAEREERMWKRARSAEEQSTEDEPIKRVVPKTKTVPADRESSMQWPAWELVEPGDDDRPEWAEEHDVIIRFDDDRREQLFPGERYPLRSIDGSPSYTTEMIGLERDVPDLKAQSSARMEQSQHLQNKGKVLGAYVDRLEVDGTIESESTVEVEDDTKALAREVLAARYGGDEDE